MKGPVFLIDVMAFLLIDTIGIILMVAIRQYFHLHFYMALIPSLIWVILIAPVIVSKLSTTIESKVFKQL